MRAVAVRAFKETPQLMEVSHAEPAPGEVLVRLEAAGVNPFDWKIVDGIFEGRRPHVFPLIVGIDGAGTVVSVGEGVRRFQVGDRVCGQFLHDPVGIGTYAEFATAPERIAISRVPKEVAVTAAAALPTAGMTALDALDVLAIPSGGTLLVVGASGGVGSIATSLAARRGITVLATTRPASETVVRKLGAKETIDPGRSDLIEAVRRMSPNGVDGLLDAGSDKPTFARYASLVRRGGTAATTTFVADESASAADGIRRVNINLQPRHALLDRLLTEAAEGRFIVPVERTMPLSEGPRALAESRARTSVGKMVLTIP